MFVWLRRLKDKWKSARMSSNSAACGWKKTVFSLDWHALACRGWPGWDRPSGSDRPFQVDTTTEWGKDRSSYKIASEFDDMAEGPFYWRDYTESGLPYVSAGEKYKSSFFFARRTDMEKFVSLYGGTLANA